MARIFNVIVGLGETGLSYARFLAARGEDFVVVDDNPAPGNMAALEVIKPGASVLPITADRLKQADKLFVSPGVPLRSDALMQARSAGVSLHGDVQLFGELAQAPVIGITGSNGKSTVSQLVFEMIRDQEKKVALAGNIGTPCLDVLAEDSDYYVLELSSYQLELATALNTRIAVVLNLVPDHLDRYQSEADYYQTKLTLYSHTENAVVNRSLGQSNLNPLTREAAATFGTDVRIGDRHFGVLTQGSASWLMQGNDVLMSVDELQVTGTHNVQNVLASLAIGWLAGLKMDRMLDTARRFQGLPHRSEMAGEVGGVLYINDSKATNPGAMVAAVKGQARGRNIHLIAGGLLKGLSLEGLANELNPYLKGIYLIGKDYAAWREEFSALAPTACDYLANAVAQAAKNAEPGDIVLLSPGCASQDQFRNYMDRGNQFKEAVGRLEP